MATVLGSWIGYRLGRATVLEQEERAAKNVARALLLELRTLEGTLRAIAAEPEPLDYKWYIPSPLLDLVLNDVRNQPESVALHAYHLHGLVQEVRSRLELFSSLPDKTAQDHIGVQ